MPLGAKRVRNGELRVALSPAMLGMLWQAQLSRGVMSIQLPDALAAHSRVQVLLAVAGSEIALAATVDTCVPRGAGFSVQVTLDPLRDPQKAVIRRIVGFLE